MKCFIIRKKLSPYMDDELDKRQKNLVEAHLQTCQSCATKLAELQEINGLLENGVRLQANSFLLTRVKANLDVRSKKYADVVRTFRQRVLASAVVVVGLFVGVLIGWQLSDILPSHRIDAQPASYSIIDSNFAEPLPSGSITATYVSLDNSIQ